MRYTVNPKNGDKISALSFGCMRFPRDEARARELVVKAIESGVNYFDTAYIYPNNEIMLGKVLPPESRKDVKLATKLPPYFVKRTEDFEKLFTTQLTRLKTDYIDYYMMHMLLSLDDWQRLVGLGAIDWINEKKRTGQIRNIGFSYHGSFDEFKKIADAYAWEFCMLQYNYLDESNQAGRKGVEYAAEKGIPLIIMEPMRGGSLAARLPKEAVKLFDDYPVKRSPAEWAFRWLWNHKEPMTILSGMNTMEALEENLRVASESEAGMLTDGELDIYAKVKQAILNAMNVGCTGCGYCVPCPRGVNIPLCFTSYNDLAIENKLTAKFHYLLRTNGHNASLCNKCGKCEQHCPQKIEIRKELEAAAKALEGAAYKPLRFIVRKAMKLK